MIERLVGASVGPLSVGPLSSMEQGEASIAREVLATVPGVASFVGSLLPLVRGERALTALPYALVIR